MFAKRCYTIGRAFKYSAEENFEEALEEADKKDRVREEAIKDKKVHELPMLHGIPISVKDMVN